MGIPVQMAGEQKAFKDVAKVVRFWPPVPVTGTPTYDVRFEGASLQSGSGTAFGSTAAISAIGADRRTLTLGSDISASLDGLIGDVGGLAILHDESTFGTIVVKVVNVATTTVTLADRLPRTVTLSSATFELKGWSETLTTGNVTDTARRNVLVKWTYVADYGDDYGAETLVSDHLLHVVPRPFTIGLTTERLNITVPGFAALVPSRQDSWGPQIAEAERWVVKQIRASRKVEDNFHGGDFDEVSAYRAAHIVLMGQVGMGADRLEAAEAFGATADELFARVMAAPSFYDSDGDGETDSGEDSVQLAGLKASWVGGYQDGSDSDFDATAAAARQMKLGQDH